MIDDGYTGKWMVGGQEVLYRPLLRDERMRLLQQFESAPDQFFQLQLQCDVRCRVDHATHQMVQDWLGDDAQEYEDEKNLAVGVYIELTHPEVSRRDCGECKMWWYDHGTGRVVRRGGKMLKRPEGSPLPCETQSGCAKGTPEEQESLSPKNVRAYEHYLNCRAVMLFPDDPIVRRNARIISTVERHYYLSILKGDVDGRRQANHGPRRGVPIPTV